MPVVEGQDTPNINFRLDVGGTISGIVTDAQGNPIERAWVETESVDGNGRSYARTGPDGSYKTIGLASGEYRVDVWAGGYLHEYYDGAWQLDSATLVAVIEGKDTPNINFSLDIEGTISGIVTDTYGSPIEGALVSATSADSGVSAGTTTAPDGSYGVHGLASGDHIVWASAVGYEGQFYDGAQDLQDASVVRVTQGEDTPDINFALLESSTPNPGQLRLDIDADARERLRAMRSHRFHGSSGCRETYEVAICVAGLPDPLSAFQVDIDYDDTLSVAPEIDCPSVSCLDDNPDANAGSTTWGDGLGSGWDCNILEVFEPVGDRDPETGADHGQAAISCWNITGPYTFGDDESSGVLALVEFTATTAGRNSLALSNVAMGDAMGIEIGSCDTTDMSVSMPCAGADVEQEVTTPTASAPPIVPPATGPGATSTATPIPTLDPNATGTATPHADGPRDSRGAPRVTPPATRRLRRHRDHRPM